MSDRFNPPLPANEEAVAAKARQPKRLPILCLDFDGVLHGYQSGWQGAAIIPDPPVPGAVQFLHGAVERFQVAIYSSRSGQPGGIDAMRGWLKMWLMAIIEDRREAEHVFDLIQWPTEKPAATVSIDDRAIQFTGVWPSLDEIAAFQPWNKRTLSAPSGAETAGGDGWRFDMEAAPVGKDLQVYCEDTDEQFVALKNNEGEWQYAFVRPTGTRVLCSPSAWRYCFDPPAPPSSPANAGAEGGQA